MSSCCACPPPAGNVFGQSCPPKALRLHSGSDGSLHGGVFSLINQGRPHAFAWTTRDALCAAKYVSPRLRPLTREEAQIRATAYALKLATRESLQVAAPTMASLITGPCWLVPIPAGDRSIKANLALARAIAALVPGARVKAAIARSQRVASSTGRRRRGLPGLRPDEHHFVRTANPMTPMPVYLVDNVITTGGTVQAAPGRAWVGHRSGLRRR